MIKYGCMALVAMACSAVAPAAQAQGNFFVAGHVGQAKYDGNGLADDATRTRALSGGYRWQAGPIVQVGIEAGLGKADEVVADEYYYNDGNGYVEDYRAVMEADYRHLGANARISFGEGSRWFAIARAGYVKYEIDARLRYQQYRDGQLLNDINESGSDDSSGAYFGAGIGVDITPNFNVYLMRNGYAYSDFESDDYSSEDIGTASTTTLGIEVRF